jgi:hypothetical protein
VASNAFDGHLEALLRDAAQLRTTARDLSAGLPGRLLRVNALNRAVVVICVSAWEAYIEELVRESLNVLRPSAPPLGVWSTHYASMQGQLGRFHNPNRENVRQLISDALGLFDIQTNWAWQNCTAAKAEERLKEAITLRNKIAHGVNPRPAVSSDYSRDLPAFFRRLGSCTDRAVHNHFTNVLGIANPWPP